MATPRSDSPAVDWSDNIEPLGATEFQRIRELAQRTFGLDLKPGKEELVSARLRRLLRAGGFSSFREYLRHVSADRSGEALSSMVDALTTNHTSFLREPDHFDFLRNCVFPTLASRAEDLQIWSAACATGEEVWTLGCMLSDVFPNRRASIVASDISSRALQFAQRAVYSADRCERIPREWLARYFQPSADPPGSYRASTALRQRASFRRINLIRSFSWPQPFPVIFCRNVMIYFDGPTQEALVDRLANALEPGGYLFVGHAESLARIGHSLEYVRPAVYRKPLRRGGKWSKP